MVAVSARLEADFPRVVLESEQAVFDSAAAAWECRWAAMASVGACGRNHIRKLEVLRDSCSWRFWFAWKRYFEALASAEISGKSADPRNGGLEKCHYFQFETARYRGCRR